MPAAAWRSIETGRRPAAGFPPRAVRPSCGPSTPRRHLGPCVHASFPFDFPLRPAFRLLHLWRAFRLQVPLQPPQACSARGQPWPAG